MKETQPKSHTPRFTVRRRYQKPPTRSVRGGPRGSTTLSREGINRTIARLKGYAISAAAEGDMARARKYQRGLQTFLSQVTRAMQAAGISPPTERETTKVFEIEGVTK